MTSLIPDPLPWTALASPLAAAEDALARLDERLGANLDASLLARSVARADDDGAHEQNKRRPFAIAPTSWMRHLLKRCGGALQDGADRGNGRCRVQWNRIDQAAARKGIRVSHHRRRTQCGGFLRLCAAPLPPDLTSARSLRRLSTKSDP